MIRRLCLLFALFIGVFSCCSCSIFSWMEEPVDYTPYDYELSEYITLGEYQSLTVKEADVTPTKQELQEQREADFSALTRLDDREIRLGDRVNLNYTAIFEKEEYDDDTDGGFFLTLGKNELGIPGFDEGLVGATPGDEIALDLVFPDDYDKEPEYAGKEVSFIVTVNYISAALPELTDEIVSTFTVYKTVEEYETGIFEAIRDVKLVGLLWQRVLDGAVVLQYPEKEYENYYTEYLDGYTSLAEGYGMTLSELVEEMGLTMDGFYQEADGVTKTYIKEDLVVYAIAEAQGITLTEEEYDAAVLDYYNASGSAYYVSAELMEQTLGRQILTQQFLSEKVLDFLCESADIQK